MAALIGLLGATITFAAMGQMTLAAITATAVVKPLCAAVRLLNHTRDLIDPLQTEPAP